MSKNEAELVEEAVEEAVGLVEDGDNAMVAVDYAAREQRDLQHRFWDIYEQVQEAVDDE